MANPDNPKTIRSDTGSWFASAGLILLFVLFLAVNVLSSGWLTSARLDLTKDKLYTLSDSTIELLKDIKEPVTLGDVIGSFALSINVTTLLTVLTPTSASVKLKLNGDNLTGNVAGKPLAIALFNSLTRPELVVS